MPNSPSWNAARFPTSDYSEANGTLAEFAGLLPLGGRALDLACGGGRHAVFLAQRGLRVVAVDRSRAALERGGELARLRMVSVAWLQADLEKFALPPAIFDVVVCTHYRDTELYAYIRESLRPGGIVFYETFSLEQIRFNIGPRNPAFLLKPGELLLAFSGWNVIFYRECWNQRGTATIVARKPAGRGKPRL